MFQPEITISGSEVFSTGTVVCRATDIIDIRPFGSTSGPYKLQIRFVVNDEKTSSIKTFSENDYRVVELTNFTNTNPVGNKTPLYVANKGGRKATLLFVNQSFGSGDGAKRVFSFTVYDGGPIDE